MSRLLALLCLIAAAQLAAGRQLNQFGAANAAAFASSSGTASAFASATASASSQTSNPIVQPAAQLPELPGFPDLAGFPGSIFKPSGGAFPSTFPTTPSAPKTPTPSATPSPSTPGAPATGGGCPDISAALDKHNEARALTGAAPLTWDSQLAADSQAWSQNCVFAHSDGGNGAYGENLAAGSALDTCAGAVDLWVAERSSYAPGMGFTEATGHYTQVVWKGTTAVGCGWAACPSFNMITCRYAPAGNVIGQFDSNV